MVSPKGPYTPKSGPLAGRAFSNYYQYQQARARQYGFASYAAERRANLGRATSTRSTPVSALVRRVGSSRWTPTQIKRLPATTPQVENIRRAVIVQKPDDRQIFLFGGQAQTIPMWANYFQTGGGFDHWLEDQGIDRSELAFELYQE